MAASNQVISGNIVKCRPTAYNFAKQSVFTPETCHALSNTHLTRYVSCVIYTISNNVVLLSNESSANT